MVNRLVAGPEQQGLRAFDRDAQYYCNVIPVLEVPPTAFAPPPKVDSAVVRPVPHSVLPNPVGDVRMLSRITTKAFNQRRKPSAIAGRPVHAGTADGAGRRSFAQSRKYFCGAVLQAGELAVSQYDAAAIRSCCHD